MARVKFWKNKIAEYYIKARFSDEPFFPEGYLLQYPDVDQTAMSPWVHYFRNGKQEGRDNGLHPSEDLFFPEGYLLQYPDVAGTGMDPWVHYVKFGKQEGRNNGLTPSEDFFSPEWYLLKYPDVAEAGINPWIHYVKFGKKEGRVKGILRNYNKILLFKDFIKECEDFGAIYGRELLDNMNDCRRVLLVSHELSLTGAPIALFYFAQNLKQKGLAPLIMSPKDGSLSKSSWEAGIPVIIYEDVNIQRLVECCVHMFSFIIVNTAIGGPFIKRLNGLSAPVLWWIHESEALYQQSMLNAMPDTIQGNIHVYCVGTYAEKMLLNNRPSYRTDQLLYYLPDYMGYAYSNISIMPEQAQRKTVFMIVGTIEPRKGHDILVQAIQNLPSDKLQDCFFLFVGRAIYKPYLEDILKLQNEHPENICYLGEVELKQMPELYKQTDCLICPSRDDPMPIVVTEALSLSKLVICSENTGSAALLEENGSGLVYCNNDVEELVQCILRVLEHGEELGEIRKAARKTYESYFSKEAFNNSVRRVLKEVLSGEKLDGKSQ